MNPKSPTDCSSGHTDKWHEPMDCAKETKGTNNSLAVMWRWQLLGAHGPCPWWPVEEWKPQTHFGCHHQGRMRESPRQLWGEVPWTKPQSKKRMETSRKGMKNVLTLQRKKKLLLLPQEAMMPKTPDGEPHPMHNSEIPKGSPTCDISSGSQEIKTTFFNRKCNIKPSSKLMLMICNTQSNNIESPMCNSPRNIPTNTWAVTATLMNIRDRPKASKPTRTSSIIWIDG